MVVGRMALAVRSMNNQPMRNRDTSNHRPEPLQFVRSLAASPQRGFTLIEVMIVMVVIAILAAIAYPSYQSQVRKSRRSDAVVLMSLVQQAQERWRANNATYTSTIGTGGLALSNASSGGYYSVATAAGAAAAAATSFTVTATAQSAQTSDTGCQALRIDTTAGNITYLAGATVGTLVDDAAARRCWNR